MFKNEDDFSRIVSGLKIDRQANPAHRQRLRRQVISVFEEAAKGSAAQAGGSWRIMLRSPLVKLAAAAVIIVGAALGAHQVIHLRKADEPAFRPYGPGVAHPTYTGTPELAVIDIDLPKPVFTGTPLDARVKNLEKPLGKPRPPFFAPIGTTNVALGRSVSSSYGEPLVGVLKLITDGNKEAAGGSYVELGPSLQYVAIDLGRMYEIYAVVMWHYHRQARVYFGVVVQVADDRDFAENVRTLFNNDTDNSAGLGMGRDLHYTDTYEGKLIDARAVRARYVRLYSNGNNVNDSNHYIEVEVYGRAVQ